MQLSWPILPPPSSTKGQLFTATLPSGKLHGALDMGAAGDAVLAAADGTVTAAGPSGDARGTRVVIDHGEGWETRYYHLASTRVGRGDVVVAGQQVGVVGATGLPKPWPHLHFEVRQGGQPLDPQALLGASQKKGSPVVGLALAVGAAWFLTSL